MAASVAPGQRAFSIAWTLAVIQVCGCYNNDSSGMGSGMTAHRNAHYGAVMSNSDAVGGAAVRTTGGGAAPARKAATPNVAGEYVVGVVQSDKPSATDIAQAEVAALVTEAVNLAGGISFIKDGMTVVLKPNLVTHLASCWIPGSATLSPTVNGVTTDWRVTKAMAELVRARNPNGKILVMEGSNRNTSDAFLALGYTPANFGASVDEFVALEGSGCADRSSAGLVQRAGASGKLYWVNSRYVQADIVISIGAMKTHESAGITGCVKNLGIGTTPSAMYSVSTVDSDCTRNMTQSSEPSFIDHSPAGLATFVSDYYSIRPADFALMDGLQGLQNGPCSTNDSDRMNMRLILASRNAVALDTVEALVMSCDPNQVPSLAKAAEYGLGTTDITKIHVHGKTIAEVKKSFVSGVPGVCN
jgi:uncharacterized protein (DUF362 family)